MSTLTWSSVMSLLTWRRARYWNSLQTSPYLWQARPGEAQGRCLTLWQCQSTPWPSGTRLTPCSPGFWGRCEEWDPSISCCSGQGGGHLRRGRCPSCQLWGCRYGWDRQNLYIRRNNTIIFVSYQLFIVCMKCTHIVQGFWWYRCFMLLCRCPLVLPGRELELCYCVYSQTTQDSTNCSTRPTHHSTRSIHPNLQGADPPIATNTTLTEVYIYNKTPL